jgi:hypothetical protein
MKSTSAWISACGVLVLLAAGFGVAQSPETPEPGREHKRLGYFVGKWTVTGDMKPGPMGPGGKFTGVDTCEWFAGGFAVVCRSEGKGPMGPTKGLAILGYSPEEKVYTYYGTDNSGAVMTTVPRGTVQGTTWTYADESTMGGEKVKSRVTIKEVSPTEYTFSMDLQNPSGQWSRLFESKATKTK